MFNSIDEFLLDHSDNQAVADQSLNLAGSIDPIKQAVDDAADEPSFRRVVLVYPWAVHTTRKIEHAIVLSQLWWWTHGRKGNNRQQGMPVDPTRGLFTRHTARSVHEVAEACGLSADSADHCVRSLQDQGLIWWRSKKFGAKKKRHIGLTNTAKQRADTQAQGRAVAYRPWLTEYVRGAGYSEEVSAATVGLVLSQLLFWYTRRSAETGRSLLYRPQEENGLPEPWFFSTNVDLAEQVGLPVARVDRAMKAAKQLNLLVIKRTMRAGKNTGRFMLVSRTWIDLIETTAMAQMYPTEVDELAGSNLTNSLDGS